MKYCIKLNGDYFAGIRRDGVYAFSKAQRVAVRWTEEWSCCAYVIAEVIGGHVVRLRPRTKPRKAEAQRRAA